MKRLFVLFLALTLVFAFASCRNDEGCTEHTDANYDGVCDTDGCSEAVTVPVMTYDEYSAAQIDDLVIIESFVQGKQSWWDNKATVYLQDEYGAYYVYEMTCSEADYAKLTAGTKVRVIGYKAEWSGEIEIIDAYFHILEGETFVAEPTDLSDKLDSEDLIDYQNVLASFGGLTVKAIEYKNGEPGDDIYLTLTKGNKDYKFCVERYLTDPESEVYTTVGTLETGDTVYVEGFLYWYEGMNPHITKIMKAMTHAEYNAAEIDDEVVVVSYVQAMQSWWDNKATIYLQGEDGAYFSYETACSEEKYNALVKGTKVLVHGYKAEWAGEVEIVDGTIEVLGGDTYVAEAQDLTALLGTDELIEHQNELALLTGMTVVSVEYKNGEPGDDIYVTLEKDGEEYELCVERYLVAPDTDLYTAIGELAEGDVIDVECFVYWYEGFNGHIVGFGANG